MEKKPKHLAQNPTFFNMCGPRGPQEGYWCDIEAVQNLWYGAEECFIKI